MKKFILSILSLVMMLSICSVESNAQNLKYQGDASMGYAFGTGTYNVNRFNITSTHGVRINEYLFAGAGLGFNFYSKEGESTTYLPIYASAKGYYPIASNLSLIGIFDLGYGANISDDSDLSGFYCYPQAGLNLDLNGRFSLDFTLGYHHQSASNNGISVNYDAIAFKVAFNW